MSVEELGILSTIWILACNDENPILTYEGIRQRLDLRQEYDVRALIRRRRELFRPGAAAETMEKWRGEMLAGGRRPEWIRASGDETLIKGKIAALTDQDVFRSQFRASGSTARSPVDVMQWGLEHLDRLRKASLEERTATAKSWQIWLVFAVGIFNIIVTLLRPR